MAEHTLHWFFSLGTGNSPATYFLTDEVAARMRPWFPALRAAVAASGPYAAADLSRARCVTAGLLTLLGQPREGVSIRFHFLATPQVGRQTAPFIALLEDAPDWAHDGMTRAGDDSEEMEARDPATIGKVVNRVVEGVSDRDLVVFETSGGLRPLVTGSILAQSVLRATRPGVTVIAAVYGEFGARLAPPEHVPESVRVMDSSRGSGANGSAAGAALSPIYDLTDFLDLPLWASAAESLRRRFDVRPLSELFSDREPALVGALDKVATALDLGWPSDLAEPLREAVNSLPDNAAAGRRAVLRLARAGLEKLATGAGDPGAPLDVVRLQFHIDIARFLAAAGRFGDAIRVLREAMVDGAILARTDVGRSTEWRQPRVRAAAERALFLEGDNELWLRLGKLRNAASHAKSSVKHDGVEGSEVARCAGLVDDVQARMLADGSLRPDFLPPREAKGTYWFVLGESPESAGGVDAALAAFTDSSNLPLRIAATGAGTRAEVTTLSPLSGLCGQNWLEKQTSKARGSADAVLHLPDRPMEQALLAEALRKEGVRPWALVGDALWPLFPKGGS